MQSINKKRAIDLLINHFWDEGYITVKRRFGTYLSDPPKIGDYEIDVIAKQKKSFAIGITFTPEEIREPDFLNKISFLATRESRFSNKRIPLFIGVPVDCLALVKGLVNSLDEISTIKVLPLSEHKTADLFDKQNYEHSIKGRFRV